MAMHPPRTLERFYSPLRAGITIICDVVACRLPRGVPLRCRNFLLLTPGCVTLFKPHTHDDVFPLPSTKSPSHALNLVGRRLLPGKTCSRHPSSKRPRVGLLLLAAHPDPDCAREQHWQFLGEKHRNAPLPPHPPPIAIPSPPPSPGAPLNNIQRVRSWSREDIEGGGLGDSKVINIIIL